MRAAWPRSSAYSGVFPRAGARNGIQPSQLHRGRRLASRGAYRQFKPVRRSVLRGESSSLISLRRTKSLVSCALPGILRAMHSQEQPALAAAVDDKPRVGWGFITLHALAYTGTWLALLTPVLLTIALKVRHLRAGEPRPEFVAGAGLRCVLRAGRQSIVRATSDRTTSHAGMRRPWLIGGVLCGALALLLIATANSYRDGAGGLVPGAARIQRGAGSHHRRPARSSSRRTARDGCWRDGCLSAVGAGQLARISCNTWPHRRVLTFMVPASICVVRRTGVRADVAGSASGAGRGDIAGLARCDRDLLGEPATASGLRAGPG